MTGAPGSPWLWALPFLLTFVGGVFADAFEVREDRWLAAAGSIVAASGRLLPAEPCRGCCRAATTMPQPVLHDT